MDESKIRVRAYNVGFGECFLLTFFEAGTWRNMLIGFGCAPRQSRLSFRAIAENIQQETGGHLDVVVVTHDHQDHIAGFLDQKVLFDQFTIDCVWMSYGCSPEIYSDKEGKAFKRIRDCAPKFAAHRNESGDKVSKPFKTLLANNIVSHSEEGQTSPKEYLSGLVSDPDNVFYLSRGDEVSGFPFSGDVKVQILAPQIEVGLYETGEKHMYFAPIADRLEAKLGGQGVAEKHPLFSKGYRNVKVVETPDSVSPQDFRILRNKNLTFGVSEFQTLDAVVNNTSLVFLMTIGGRKLLFAGDAQELSWEWIGYCDICSESDIEIENCARCANFRRELYAVDFLKLSAHDTPAGLSQEVIESMFPESIIMVSTDSEIGYGEAGSVPDRDLLNRLREKHGENLIVTNDENHREKLWVDAFI